MTLERLQVQILEGLEDGAEVVVHPGDDVTDGRRIRPR